MRLIVPIVAALALALAASMAPAGAGTVYSPKEVHAWPKDPAKAKSCRAVKFPLDTAARRHDYWKCTGRTR